MSIFGVYFENNFILGGKYPYIVIVISERMPQDIECERIVACSAFHTYGLQTLQITDGLQTDYRHYRLQTNYIRITDCNIKKQQKKRSFYFKHDRRTRVTIVTLGIYMFRICSEKTFSVQPRLTRAAT